jgi:hypothetical protein
VGGAPEDFEELWAIWSSARLHNTNQHKAEARPAYAIVRRDAATHNEIMIRARQYLAAKADDRRHVHQLANWLSNDNWRKPPPERRPARNTGKVSMANIAVEIGREGEDQ